MDTGQGELKRVIAENEAQLQERLAIMRAENPQHGGTFYVGQNLEFEGSKFRVLQITKKTLVLRVLPREQA